MKQHISNYTFDASARVITCPDFMEIALDRLLLITNTTTNTIIYNFADPTMGATVSDHTITLGYDTSAMSDADTLMIFYDVREDDPYQDGPIFVYQDPMASDYSTATKQDTTNTKLDTVHDDLTAIDGHVDGIETLIGTSNGELGAIVGYLSGTLSVNGSAHTQPVSASSLPLPTGASTSAKQDTGNTSLAAIDTKLGGTIAVSAASLPLPSGAATSAAQTTAQTSLSAIDTKLAGTLTVDGSGHTQPVSVSSLPLPSGAATSAAQATAQTSLSAIAASVAGTLTVSAASLPLPSGAATSAKQDTGNTSVASIDGKTPALGQALAAASVPVVLTAAQISTLTPVSTVTANIGTTNGLALDATLTGGTQKSKLVDSGGTNVATVSSGGALKVDGSAVTQPVSAASLPLPSGAATSALQTTGNTSLSSIDGKTPALGQALAAASTPVVLTAAQMTTLTPTAGVALDATLTGGTQQSKITDGSTVASVVSGDSGNNGLAVVPARKEVSFTTTTVQAVASTDVSNYKSVSVQINTQGTTSTVTFQGSNDNSTWVNVALLGVGVFGGAAASTSTTNASVAFAGPINMRYFRLNVTGISALTTAGVIEFFTTPYGFSFPISAASQSGTWTVQPGNTANTTAWKVDGSAVTQPVSNASLPLPLGASTAAKQPALGTAGTASADVISVQGVASMTALKVDGSAVTQPVSMAAAPTGAALDATLTGGTQVAKAVGDIAAGASDSGAPVKMGAVGKTANPTAVTDGQRANLIADKLGKQVVVGSIRDLKANQLTTITSSVAETTIVTGVASVFLDLYGLIITNSSTTVCKVTIKDATAGTTRAVFVVPANDTRGFMLPESGAMKQSTVNNNWTATCGTSVADIVITAMTVQNT